MKKAVAQPIEGDKPKVLTLPPLKAPSKPKSMRPVQHNWGVRGDPALDGGRGNREPIDLKRQFHTSAKNKWGGKVK